MRLYLTMKILLFYNICVHFLLQERLEEMKEELFPNQSEVSFDEYQLNVQLSNRLPLVRNIPDARPPECLARRYEWCAFEALAILEKTGVAILHALMKNYTGLVQMKI